MSSTKKSDQSGELLFSTSLEKELLEFLSVDEHFSDPVAEQAALACLKELSPPDDSVLRCQPVFLKEEPASPVFSVKEEKLLPEQKDEKEELKEYKKGIQFIGLEETNKLKGRLLIKSREQKV